MVIKDGFLVDFELRRERGGRHSYYVAMEDRQRPGVFHVGGYQYDQYGVSPDPHAPKIVDAWCDQDETKGHAKERRMRSESSWLDDLVRHVENHGKPWQSHTRLFEMRPWQQLRGTCLACGLTVVHSVRRMIEEARYGNRTVEQIESVSVCRRKSCEGRIKIELDTRNFRGR